MSCTVSKCYNKAYLQTEVFVVYKACVSKNKELKRFLVKLDKLYSPGSILQLPKKAFVQSLNIVIYRVNSLGSS